MPTLSQQNEWITFDNRTVHVDDVVRLLNYLQDEGIIGDETFVEYHDALADHFHRGILPGFSRFFVPSIAHGHGRHLYFLPALATLYRMYIDDGAIIADLRLEFEAEADSDTDETSSMTYSDVTDPTDVINQCLLDAITIEFNGDEGNEMEFDNNTV